ncbi:hypothetical protein ACWCXX_37630 [Streptomyces sp. NPDC001732]
MTRELFLVCQGCGHRISDDAGYLWAHTAEVNAVQREWKAQHARAADRALAMDLVDLLEGPDQARWQATHVGCDPERGGSHYRVAAGKLRTRADLLDWTAHLMEKNWLPATDWHDLLREARKGGERLAVIAPEPSRGPL